MVIILVLVAIAVPLYLRQRMNANEGAAVGALRTISSAQVSFQSSTLADADQNGTGDFGTLEQLATVIGNSQPFIDEVLGTGTRQGYSFTIEVFPGSTSFAAAYSARAVPLSQGRTGTRRFYVDQSGVLRFTGDGSAVGPDSPPVN